MRLFKRDTQPVIRLDGYEFGWTQHGLVAVTKQSGTKTYSVDALERLATSRGMSESDREMASAALTWIQSNPFTRKSNEYNTTPSL